MRQARRLRSLWSRCLLSKVAVSAAAFTIVRHFPRSLRGGGGISGGILKRFLASRRPGRRSTTWGGFALRHANTRSRKPAFGAEKESKSENWISAIKCGGTGAESGGTQHYCPFGGGRGQVISSRGFFQVSQKLARDLWWRWSHR